MEGNLLTYISESYFEQQKTDKYSCTAHTNKLFAYERRGLGLSCAVGACRYLCCWYLDVPRTLFITCWAFRVFTLKSNIMNKPNNSITRQELQVFMDLHEIKSLGALLEYDNVTLLEMQGFGWRLMKEVLDLREI